LKEAVAPFFQPMSVRPGDWLQVHPEDGQTFDEYLNAKPTLPTAERKIIYIQPVGTFTTEQKKALRLAAGYMQAFLGLPVRLEREQRLDKVPPKLTRTRHPNNRQIRTAFFLDTLLPDMLAPDATALICLTNSDLYLDEQSNFVFGQAALQERVGVYSLYRLRRNTSPRETFDIFLDRTLKIAMHETGHMFGMLHCTKYECLMSGTNHLAETDRRPLDVCPECMAKVSWGLKYDPLERYNKLAAFWAGIGRSDEQKRVLAIASAIQAAMGRR
jgi:archaemetzincin